MLSLDCIVYLFVCVCVCMCTNLQITAVLRDSYRYSQLENVHAGVPIIIVESDNSLYDKSAHS